MIQTTPTRDEAVPTVDQSARQAAITMIENDWAGDIPSYAAALVDAVLASYLSALPPVTPVAWVNDSYRDEMIERAGKVYWYGPNMCGQAFKGSHPVYLAAPLASAPAPASGGVDTVAVKALEWNPFSAETVIGRYDIADQSDASHAREREGRPPFLLAKPRAGYARFDTLVEARAAAQADYEQRIRSTLSPAATPVSEAEPAAVKHGPYRVRWLGAGVWAGINDELPAELEGKDVWITPVDGGSNG